MDMKFLKVRRMLGTRSLLDGNDLQPPRRAAGSNLPEEP